MKNNWKNIDSCSDYLSELLQSIRQDKQNAFVRSLNESSKNFASLLEDVCSIVSRTRNVSAAFAKVFCSLICLLERRSLKISCPINFDQKTVQSVCSCFVKLYKIAGMEEEVLKSLSAWLQDCSHMLGKDLQDSVMTLLLARAKVVIPSVKREAIVDEEDSKDGQDDSSSTSVAGGSQVVVDDVCCAALQCLVVMASQVKVRKKGYFVEYHLKGAGDVAFYNSSLLVKHHLESVTVLRPLSHCMSILEYLSYGGQFFLSQYNSKIHGLVSWLCPLLLVQTYDPRIRDLKDLDSSAGLTSEDGASSSSASSRKVLAIDRLRVHCLLTLSALCANCYKTIMNDMFMVLPYSIGEKEARFRNSLYGLILYDKNYKIRFHSLMLLNALLKPSKSFFSSAVDTQQVSSFLSLSHKQGLVLKDLHKVLSIVLVSEEDEKNRSVLFRLIVVVASITPYEKFAPHSSLLLPILKGILTKTTKGEVMALNCVLGILKIKSHIHDIAQWITFCSVQDILLGILKSRSEDSMEMKKVADACFVEICARYHRTLKNEMELLSFLVKERQTSDSLRSVIEYASSLASEEEEGSAGKLKTFWNAILSLVMQEKLSENTPEVLTLLSSVPEHCWRDQPSSVQLTIVATVTSSFEDEENSEGVRMAALKGIGRLLMLDSLVVANDTFLFDAKKALEKALTMKSAEMVATCFWCLGNLSSALLMAFQNETDDTVKEDFKHASEDILKIVLTAMKEKDLSDLSPNQKEKFKCSCLRLVGKCCSVLGLAFEGYIESSFACCLTCLGPKERPKLRWNAIVALASILREYTSEESLRHHWKSDIGVILKEAWQTGSNYKEKLSIVGMLDDNCGRAWVLHEKDVLLIALNGLFEEPNVPKSLIEVQKSYQEALKKLVVKYAHAVSKDETLKSAVEEEVLLMLREKTVFERQNMYETLKAVLGEESHILIKRIEQSKLLLN